MKLGSEFWSWSNFSCRILAPRWFLLVTMLATLSVTFASCGYGQQNKPQEYQVKAVYLYNFGKFVEWPAEAAKDGIFGICVLGFDPFGTVLDTTLSGEAIDNRKLLAKRIADVREAAGCQILFISSSEISHVKEILSVLGKSPVLTVSDMTDFAGRGGMIQFLIRENKVRFEVNLSAAEKAGLTLSSQLLKVATDIQREPRGADIRP